MTDPWTEADIPDQTGRVAIITGANSGIGYEAARALVRKGAHVVLACRSVAKAESAIEDIHRHDPPGTTEVLEIDLADLDSVADAAKRFSGGSSRLDLLINNAGLMAIPHRRTAQGFEMQIGVNHLGHFALTGRLLPDLLATSGSRVVNIASMGHRMGRINFDDLQSERRYVAWLAYGQSKLANLLFTFELQRRLADFGASTIATAAHPGTAVTNLGREPANLLGRVVEAGRGLVDRFVAQTPAMGALPTLRAATDPAAEGGDYFGPNGLAEQRGHPVKVGASKRAKDAAAAARLWDVSVDLTGVGYEPLS